MISRIRLTVCNEVQKVSINILLSFMSVKSHLYFIEKFNLAIIIEIYRVCQKKERHFEHTYKI